MWLSCEPGLGLFCDRREEVRVGALKPAQKGFPHHLPERHAGSTAPGLNDGIARDLGPTGRLRLDVVPRSLLKRDGLHCGVLEGFGDDDRGSGRPRSGLPARPLAYETEDL